MIDCGTAGEDGPVTWEALARPRVRWTTGRRYGSRTEARRETAGRATEPYGSQGAERPILGGKVRRGQTEGVRKRQGRRRAAYER